MTASCRVLPGWRVRPSIDGWDREAVVDVKVHATHPQAVGTQRFWRPGNRRRGQSDPVGVGIVNSGQGSRYTLEELIEFAVHSTDHSSPSRACCQRYEGPRPGARIGTEFRANRTGTRRWWSGPRSRQPRSQPRARVRWVSGPVASTGRLDHGRVLTEAVSTEEGSCSRAYMVRGHAGLPNHFPTFGPPE